MARKAAIATESRNGSRTLSDEHKQALALGRTQGRAVRAYLEALEAHKPKRGRKRTAESITKRLERITDELETADPVKRVSLIQEQFDLQNELEAMSDSVDLAALEADFIEHAWNYSQAKGISKAAWRSAGVPAAVLRQAGF
jgi:type I site-specific restriction-modification system R (restriction) subunit